MAKRRRKTRKATAAAPTSTVRTIVRRAPAARRVASAARAGASKALAKAKENKHILAGLAGAAILGFVEVKGLDAKLPKLPILGTAGTLGILGAVAGHYMKNDTIKHVALGSLAVAAYRLGVQAGGGSPAGVSGDIGAAPAAAMLNPAGGGYSPAQAAMIQAAMAQAMQGDEDDMEGDEDDMEGDDYEE